MQLARTCQHEEAKWLSALFADVDDVSAEDMKRVLLAQGDDQRAATLLAVFDSELARDAVRRAAEAGYAPAQAALARAPPSSAALTWAEKAAAQGDRSGICRLAQFCWVGLWGESDRKRAATLFLEAAEMGCQLAQFYCGERCFGAGDWQRYFWWGRSAAKKNIAAIACLRREAVRELSWCEAPENKKHASGRILFELGAAYKGHVNVQQGSAFDVPLNSKALYSVQRVLAMHDKWCEDATRSIYCWIWVGRQLGVVRDIRRVVARMVWQDKCGAQLQ